MPSQKALWEPLLSVLGTHASFRKLPHLWDVLVPDSCYHAAFAPGTSLIIKRTKVLKTYMILTFNLLQFFSVQQVYSYNLIIIFGLNINHQVGYISKYVYSLC